MQQENTDKPIHYSEVTTHNVEVKSGTAVTLSCVISGITEKVDVEWLPTPDTNYISNPGTFDDYQTTQTATLSVAADMVSADKTFTCRVHSTQFSDSPSSDTKIKLNVYGELPTLRFISTGYWLIFKDSISEYTAF